MGSGKIVDDKLQAALDDERWDDMEELWLEALEVDPIPIDILLEIRRQLYEAGRKPLALTLLDLLVDSLENRSGPQATLTAMRELVRLKKSTSEDELERLIQTFAKARAGSPSLEQVLSRFSITTERHPLQVLETMELWLDHDVGSVVEVIGQGVGRVVDINLELNNVKVDIGGHRPVSVPFGAVSRYIRRLPEGDFLRRKVEEPDALIKLVKDDPGTALVELLESLGKPCDVASIKAALIDILPTARWTSWWGKARKHPRVVSAGSGSRLRYSLGATASAATDALLKELASADPAKRPTIARRLASRGDAGADDAVRVLAESLADLEANSPGLAWETASVLKTLPGGAPPAEASLRRLVETEDPQALLNGVSDRALRGDALACFREAREEDWIEIWSSWLLSEDAASNLNSISEALISADAESALAQSVDKVMRNHLEHATQFIWMAETMTEPGCPPAISRHLNPSLLEKIPDALSRPIFSSLRSRAKGLLDGGKAAIRVILDHASPTQADRFAGRVARIDCVEPGRVHIIQQAVQQRKGAPAVDEGPLLVATREAIVAKQAELKQLVEVEIPKTLKGINAAAAEGDLRENFEYHMLRDRQELQSARAAKIQKDLGEVRTLEPGAADTSRVNIGTVVHFKAEDGSTIAPLTILGAWNADLDLRIFANGTELAIGLLGRSVGDEVEVEGQVASITEITAWPTD